MSASQHRRCAPSDLMDVQLGRQSRARAPSSQGLSHTEPSQAAKTSHLVRLHRRGSNGRDIGDSIQFDLVLFLRLTIEPMYMLSSGTRGQRRRASSALGRVLFCDSRLLRPSMALGLVAALSWPAASDLALEANSSLSSPGCPTLLCCAAAALGPTSKVLTFSESDKTLLLHVGLQRRALFK
jgi:hypothetical protein